MSQSRGSGLGAFGLIGLLIVLAVVLYLSANSFKTSVPLLTGPAGTEVSGSGDSNVVIDGQPQSLRGLDHMKKQTSKYTSEMNDAIDELNESIESDKGSNP